MYQIWHNSRQEGHDFESFIAMANKICEKHQNEGRASAFVFLLYDAFNPEIRNLLYDENYWNSLDKISGSNITVFSIKVKERRRVKARTSKSSNRSMEYLTTLHTAIDLFESNEKILSKLFGRNEDIKLPGLLFFQVLEGSIIDNFYIELQERNTESAFNEIKDYLTKCAETLGNITPENKRNYNEIFNLLKEDLINLNRIKFVTKKLPAIRTIGQLFGLIT